MTRSCVHDIPVRIIHMDYWKEFKDPPAVDYDVSSWIKIEFQYLFLSS